MKINFSTKIIFGILITLIYLLIQLAIINHYGVSWDFHYHFYAGLYHLGFPVPKISDVAPVPFTPPDPRLTVEDPFGPFTQILPALSYKIFYEKLNWLPFDSAYNLPMVIFGSLGVGVLYFFVLEAVNFPAAIFSSLFLSLLPNYFGYLHTNMKDVPNAVAFALAIYLFWRLVKYRRLRDLIIAVISFAIAFNIKVNSVLIPVICLVWLLISFRNEIVIILQRQWKLVLHNKTHLIISYFLFILPASLFIWWPFWRDPLGKLLELPYFYSHNTLNMPVLFFGNIYRSGVNIPWYYPYVYLGITTPLPILLFFLFGLFFCIKKIRTKNNIYLLFILWFFIPLLRYFSSKNGAIDGVRHFMEVVYPLSVIAGFGAENIYHVFIKAFRNKYITASFIILILILLIKNIVKFHPYETSYFNNLIGGINGANGKFDIDFWGTPQKEAMLWLNQNVPGNSSIHVVMAQSSAGIYLRPDLLKGLNSKEISKSDYTVVLNRESFFNIYNVYDYLNNKSIIKNLVYQKTIDGVPLVSVYKNHR